jgi:hypothetical protein
MLERRTCVGGSRYMLTVNGRGGSPVIAFAFGLSLFFYLAESLRFIMTRLSQHKMTYIGRSPNLLSIDPQLEDV